MSRYVEIDRLARFYGSEAGPYALLGARKNKMKRFVFADAIFCKDRKQKQKIPETGGEEGKVKGKIRQPHHVSLYVSRPKHFRCHWNFSMCLFIMCSIIPCILSFVGDPHDVSPIVLFQMRCFLYRLGYELVEKQKAHLPFCFLQAARTGVSQKTKTKRAFCFCKKTCKDRPDNT